MTFSCKKYPKARDNSTKFKSFYERATTTLFDIAVCKCLDFSMCKCKIKIPIREREFLSDQRGSRKMMIGSLDLKMTKMLKRRLERKERVANRKKTKDEINFPSCNTFSGSESYDEAGDVMFFSRSSPVPSISSSEVHSNQMRTKLPNVAIACDRTGVSDRSAAIITSALLQDLGHVTPQNQELVIDRSKLRRQRKNTRYQMQIASRIEVIVPLGIYFDGRKDKTLVYEKIGTQYRRNTKIEEHIVLISEPGSSYMGHVTPESSSAYNIAKGIKDYMNDNAIDISQLVAIGCDGTAVNTGNKNGVICQLERFLKRPLQWFICLLHANELPLRHLFHTLVFTPP